MDKVYYSRAVCIVCGGPIGNYPISRSSREVGKNQWSHRRREDWMDDVHQAVPAAGSVVETNVPVGV